MSRAGRTDAPPPRGDAGYTYPAVLIALVVLSLSVHATSIPASGKSQTEREAELLFRGLAYRDAIAAYHAQTAAFPARLEDLITDPDDGGTRYIRRLYDDPMPKGGWRTLEAPGGGIAGVASTAPGTPRRKAFFGTDLPGFATAESYADWQFVFSPKAD